MIVVQTYKKDAGGFSGLVSAINFGSLKKRLSLYFKDVGQVKARLYAGEKIDIPYLTLMADRRVSNKRVKEERRLIQV